MDICGLLRKVEQLHTEVASVKHALHLQTETSEGLRAVTADVSRRVGALENYADHGCAGHIAPVKRLDAVNASAAGSTSTAAASCADGSAGGIEAPGDERRENDPLGWPLLTVERATPAAASGITMPSPGSPKWNQVVKRGQRKHTESADAKRGLRTGKSTLGQKKAGVTIVGTGTAGGIKVVTTKLRKTLLPILLTLINC
ncbi:unnamed protein product [Merluccius merluccius]